MENIFWEVFKKSGSIDAFLAYKEFKNTKSLNKSLDDLKE